MLVLQFLLALGFALLVQAKMSTEFVTHAVDVFEIKDFLVFNLLFTENRDPSTRATNHTLSFVFSDPNSNTTIQCGENWTKSAESDGTPFNYIYCGNGPNDLGFSSFRFTTYTSASNFELQLTHGFSDPTHYPPPYAWVQYFAPLSIELECHKLRNSARCTTPGPVRGVINRISN